jgi:hypothetical protein
MFIISFLSKYVWVSVFLQPQDVFESPFIVGHETRHLIVEFLWHESPLFLWELLHHMLLPIVMIPNLSLNLLWNNQEFSHFLDQTLKFRVT